MKKLIILIIAAALLLFGCNADNDVSFWGKGITEGIPAFDGELASTDTDQSGSYFTAYYNNVSGEQISDYISAVEQKCGVSFTGDRYPRSAIYSDRIIAIHYNVTEMRFSVTVTKIS